MSFEDILAMTSPQSTYPDYPFVIEVQDPFGTWLTMERTVLWTYAQSVADKCAELGMPARILSEDGDVLAERFPVYTESYKKDWKECGF